MNAKTLWIVCHFGLCAFVCARASEYAHKSSEANNKLFTHFNKENAIARNMSTETEHPYQHRHVTASSPAATAVTSFHQIKNHKRFVAYKIEWVQIEYALKSANVCAIAHIHKHETWSWHTDGHGKMKIGAHLFLSLDEEVRWNVLIDWAINNHCADMCVS